METPTPLYCAVHVFDLRVLASSSAPLLIEIQLLALSVDRQRFPELGEAVDVPKHVGFRRSSTSLKEVVQSHYRQDAKDSRGWHQNEEQMTGQVMTCLSRSLDIHYERRI